MATKADRPRAGAVLARLKPLLPWVAATAVVALVLAFAFEPPRQTTALNVASLLGILALAIPAVRINEQGRIIDRVRALQAGIDSKENALQSDRTLSAERRAAREDAIQRDRERLAPLLRELTEGKGAWTPLVHRTLYSGYVLILGAAVARVIPGVA